MISDVLNVMQATEWITKEPVKSESQGVFSITLTDSVLDATLPSSNSSKAHAESLAVLTMPMEFAKLVMPQSDSNLPTVSVKFLTAAISIEEDA